MTDEEIARKIQGGDASSFALVMERYEEKMKRYAKHFLFQGADADDVVQDIFIKAYKNIQSFDIKRKFSSWIYRIAHNEFINAIKKRKREPVLAFDPDTIFPLIVSKERTEKSLEEKEIQKLLACCLDKLDPKYREPLTLFYFEDLDYKSIADVLHIPISTVGVRITRGKGLLKKYIKHIDSTYE